MTTRRTLKTFLKQLLVSTLRYQVSKLTNLVKLPKVQRLSYNKHTKEEFLKALHLT